MRKKSVYFLLLSFVMTILFLSTGCSDLLTTVYDDPEEMRINNMSNLGLNLTGIISSNIVLGLESSEQSIVVYITWNQDITGFTSSDISLNNAVVSGFTGSGKSYSFNLEAVEEGVVGFTISLEGLSEDLYSEYIYTAGSGDDDDDAPTVGSSGTLTTSGLTSNEVTIDWTAATDNVTAQEKLIYMIYYSTDSAMDSVSDIESNGTSFGTIGNKITEIITGLTSGVIYYINVIVMDEAGNKTCYSRESVNTVTPTDTTDPEVENKVLTISNITSNGVKVDWTAASDNITTQEKLKYKIYYSTDSAMDSVSEIENNGTSATAFKENITSDTVSSLTAGTEYYINVIIMDEAGNKNCYSQELVETVPSTDTIDPEVDNKVLITSNITSNGVMVEWIVATDNMSAVADLEYQLYYSTNSAMDSVEDIENNGTAFGTIGNKITETITVLASGVTYYLNVIVMDEAGNKTSYCRETISTDDDEAPTAGNSGTLTTSNITGNGVMVDWTAAIDNKDDPADLQYCLYYSINSAMDTISEIEAGTAVSAFQKDITSDTISSLTSNETYYLNVIVKDDAGNKAVYNNSSIITLDNVVPTAGNSGTLTTSAITGNGAKVEWTAATDNKDNPEDLQYRLYYSTNSAMDTISEIEAGTAVSAFQMNITSDTISSLTSNATYYFNVIVKDEAGNKAVYNNGSIITLDNVVPTAGNSGTLITSGLTSNEVTVNWTAATDNKDNSADLQYQLYYSTSSAMDFATEVEINGTPVGNFQADITVETITGLTEGTDYYLNVIVKDIAGNKAAYFIQALTTPIGEMGISISIDSPVADTITFSKGDKVEVAMNENLVINISESFDSYQWYLDGIIIGTTASITIDPDADSLDPGNHGLTIITVNQDGESSSESIIFIVTN